MKKTFLKILTILLVFMLLFTLASCGKDKNEKQTGKAKTGGSEIELPII